MERPTRPSQVCPDITHVESVESSNFFIVVSLVFITHSLFLICLCFFSTICQGSTSFGADGLLQSISSEGLCCPRMCHRELGLLQFVSTARFCCPLLLAPLPVGYGIHLWLPLPFVLAPERLYCPSLLGSVCQWAIILHYGGCWQ